MDRYQTKPSKPKILAKSTLNRLADPVRGRHESPQKVRTIESRPPRRVAGVSIPSEPVYSKFKQQYHSSVIESDHKRRPSPITSPHKQNAARDKEADSFFLTGLMNGESDDEPEEQSHRMNVRVRFDHGDDEMYSPRTQQYMNDVELEAHQEELLRQVKFPSPKRETISFRESMEESRAAKAKKTASSTRKTAKISRDTRSKNKSKLKAKAKSGVGAGSDKHKGHVGSSVTASKMRNRSNAHHPVPVAGMRSSHRDASQQRKQPPQRNMDPLLGLERVDAGAGAGRGGSSLLRSSSGVGSRSTRQMYSKNVLGTRSAPTLSKTKQTQQINDGTDEPCSGAVNPMVSKARRLLGRVGGSQSINKLYGDKLERSGVGQVKLQPLHQDKSADISRAKLPSRVAGGGVICEFPVAHPGHIGTLPVVGGGSRPDSGKLKKSLSMKTAPAQMDPSDDQLASLFAAHAKKLSASLEKADHLNAQYKSLRNFDGYLYASRHNVDTMLPKNADKSGRHLNTTADSTSAPAADRLKIVI